MYEKKINKSQGEKQNTSQKSKLNTALYIRLSREDGDKGESVSIANQCLLLEDFVKSRDDLCIFSTYIDDGYTGTNFQRPNFMRMIADIEEKKIQCVVVKDLSRLGRNMPKVSEYINDYFPRRKVLFISINDGINRNYYDMDTSEDMMIDIKNMFNGFYPKDISKKVRSIFRAKQGKGQFIGAFASFGYVKSADDHNRLEIDEYAASIVRRIFGMYLGGMGQNTIAKVLNSEGILCPSEYKKQCGLNYHNGNRLDSTSCWTYSTIRNILKNEMYIGNMVQNKNFRQMCKQNAVLLPKDKWIVVEGTHEAIIDMDTWDKVQDLLGRNTRQTKLEQNIHMFAGFLKCGDCGRAMVKIIRKGVTFFNCGSYNRYGRGHCSIHSITEKELESIILHDLSLIIKSVKDMNKLIEEEQKQKKSNTLGLLGDISKYQAEMERLEKKKEHAYEDYSDGVISKEEYIKHRGKYEQQIDSIRSKIEGINHMMESQSFASNPWIDKLLQNGQLGQLDRETVVEMISMIYIYEGQQIKIIYNFSDELEALLENHEQVAQDKG